MSKKNIKKTDSKEVLKKVLIIAAVVVVAALLIGLTVYNSLADSGIKERKTTALETENFSFSASDMSYFFYSTYQNMNSLYSQFGIDLGIKKGVSLKNQNCDMAEGTWYDYFMGQAVDSASDILSRCEAAKAAGIELDDEDYDSIDAYVDGIAESAEANNYSLKNYIRAMYGLTVNESDLRHCAELSVLADKYSQSISDAVDVSDETLEKEYEAHKDTYDRASYLTFAFDYKDVLPEAEKDEEGNEIEPDEATKAAAIKTAREGAEKLAACTDEESFTAAVKAYLKNSMNLSDEDIESAIPQLTKKGATLNSSDEKSAWIFTANKGDVKEFDDEENGVFTVILVTESRARDESIASADTRHVLFNHSTYENDTEPRKIYDKWVADGAKEEDLIALAKEYSEDPGSAENGGLYEDVAQGSFITEYDEWLFDGSRKAGDYDFIESKDYGWHIVYYVAAGDTSWKSEIKTNLRDAAVDKANEEAKAQYVVTSVEKALDMIDA
ncbi:MAG: peptidylprolyl isomerase [Clostridia bacterium]|nr:peptidylprolyl isomerase [Clostridia bacterium]